MALLPLLPAFHPLNTAFCGHIESSTEGSRSTVRMRPPRFQVYRPHASPPPSTALRGPIGSSTE
eukprot:4729667-Pyramimonas_sp.AAC.1